MRAGRHAQLFAALLAFAAPSVGCHGSSDAPPGNGAPDASGRAAARPGPTNTGVPAGIVLIPSGPIVVDTDGAVVENLDVDGSITVLANDVTIRNTRVTSGDYYPIRYCDGPYTGLLVEDSEIVGIGADPTSAIAFENYTARRLNVHGTADGFKANANVLIEDCWIHDLANADGQHNDGVQVDIWAGSTGSDVVLRHNDISGASNAAVQTGGAGAIVGLALEDNWFDGGGWTLNLAGNLTGTRIVGNRFGRSSAYGPAAYDDPQPIVEGNVWADTGEPLDL